MYKDIVWLRRLRPQYLKRLVGVVVILIILTTLATVWLWHKQGRDRQRAFASTIYRKTELLNARFDRFLEPVLLNLRALGQMGERGILSTENVDLTRGIVEPIVNAYRYQDPNEDKFFLHFNNLIKQHIGLEHSKHIRFSIKRIQSRLVLVVDCQKSDKPVFLKDKADEDFYVRVGPGTRKLSTREVLKSLHSQRWGQAGEDT